MIKMICYYCRNIYHMQKLYILLFFIGNMLATQAQDVKDILTQSFNKCQSIKSGHFTLTGELRKVFVYNKYSYKINFRKTPSDTVATCLYNAQMLGNKNNYGNIIYNGKFYISYNMPLKTNYGNSTSLSGVNWLFPIDGTTFRNNFITDNYYTQDWFYRGVDIPSGAYANYLRGVGNNWQNPQSSSTLNQGEIITTLKYSNIVQQKCFNDMFMLYEPVMAKKSVLLPNYAALSDSSTTVEFVNIETLNGYKCWHVKAIKTVNNNALNADAKGVYTTHYWINMQDYIPVQLSITKQTLTSSRVLFYKTYTITDYNFDVLKEDWYFSTARVPNEITLKRYVAKSEKKR
jgi:hypothetical protein